MTKINRKLKFYPVVNFSES